MTTVASQEIVSAHSPDSDDAFMFYALATKKVRSPRVTCRHVLSDIETLNRQAMEGVYDLSAISYHAYPYVADKYVLMASGSSIDRKSTRLNSSHLVISYAVFCLKKKEISPASCTEPLGISAVDRPAGRAASRMTLFTVFFFNAGATPVIPPLPPPPPSSF